MISFEKKHTTNNQNETTQTVYLSNYDLAETQVTMNEYAKSGSFGDFVNQVNIQQIDSVDQYQIVRMNRDTLYSSGVYDLTNQLTITLPPTNGYYMSLEILDEEQYVLGVVYPQSSASTSVNIIYSKSKMSTNQTVYSTTKYVFMIIRTLVDPNNQTDLARARGLQTSVKVKQLSKGKFEIKNWDLTSLAAVRQALSSLVVYVQPGVGLNGYRGKIDPTYQLIGSAATWGGLPPQDAVYQAFFPPNIDDVPVYYIYVAPNSVPIYPIGFWSVTVYNATSYLQYNKFNSYNLNSITSKPEANGYIIYFSSAEKRQDYMTNWIWIYPGWNYLVRLYRPKEQVVNLTWQFPPLQQLN